MKLISDTAGYALRAVIWLAQDSARAQTTKQIAEGTRTPRDYQSKVVQLLSKAGIVKSQRGIGGGVRLIVPPQDLSVLDVVRAVDPMQRIHTCPLGLPEHGTCLCPLHSAINDAVDQVESAMENVKIPDLLRPAPSIPLGITLPDSLMNPGKCESVLPR